MEAHPGWILEKFVCKLSSRRLCSHLESPCSTRAALHCAGCYCDCRATAAMRHIEIYMDLMGRDFPATVGQSQHFYTTTSIKSLFPEVSALPSIHFLPKSKWDSHRFWSVTCLHTVWSHQAPPVSPMSFSSVTFVLPPGQLWLPLKSYPFLECELPSPLLLNKCIFWWGELSHFMQETEHRNHSQNQWFRHTVTFLPCSGQTQSQAPDVDPAVLYKSSHCASSLPCSSSVKHPPTTCVVPKSLGWRVCRNSWRMPGPQDAHTTSYNWHFFIVDT